jgi:L-alanine-DL-glutamate epimerase-like enolase superfamily enzyme
MFCPHYLGGAVGLLASAHLLAAVGGDGRLEVDAQGNPLRDAVFPDFPHVRAGRLTLSEAPGLGLDPDPEFLKRSLAA